ncbi:hypothetical protein BaRGS_00039101 [Batillaria attramentaria]|uniref:Uncharacterized protein n=1 Tax=Batillaria attramentaria TaxID=370345 RepID=A0ABD0J4R0_9CAEN
MTVICHNESLLLVTAENGARARFATGLMAGSEHVTVCCDFIMQIYLQMFLPFCMSIFGQASDAGGARTVLFSGAWCAMLYMFHFPIFPVDGSNNHSTVYK